MIASENSKKRTPQDPIPAGLQLARCYGVFDTGTHHDTMYDKDKRECVVVFEVPSVRIKIQKEGEEEKDLPRAISQKYTISLHEKANLRKHLESWRGRAFTTEELAGFDLKNIVDKPCLLNIIHNTPADVTYANISTITPLMTGMEPAKAENAAAFFSFDDCVEGVEPDFPEGMPAWIVEQAKESREYKSLMNPQKAPVVDVASVTEAEMVGEVGEDSAPF